jgi:hypothetical protein
MCNYDELAEGRDQLDLFRLLPGTAGGRALRDQYGLGYLNAIGATGGQTTRDRYGLAYMRQLASAGGKAKRTRLYSVPQTITGWDGVRHRRIPYWPRRRQRKRPLLVRIELGEGAA